MFNWGAVEEKLKSQADAAELPKERILVVDDEEGNRSLLEGILSRDYSIVLAEDGEQALLRLNEHSDISAILCDHRMPGMTGVEFFTELERQNHRATRVILTGFAELESVINGINEAGIFRYMTKPVGKQQLKSTVREAILHFSVRQENNRLIALVKDLLEENSEFVKEREAHGMGSIDGKGRHHDLMEPKRIALSVLFVDIRGFTKLSADTSATEVIRVLQQVFKPLHDIIYDCGGMVDKHLGDGIMAVFGLAGAGGELAAVKAMRTIVDTFPKVLDSLTSPDFKSMRLSLGLASGEVVMGMLGSERRSELAVIGQPANLAHRLQEFSKTALKEEGAAVLGQFSHAMGLCSADLVKDIPGFKVVDLEELEVRDFGEIQQLGVIAS